MPSSILFHKDRKTSDKIMWFVIIMLVIAAIAGFFITNKKANPEPDQKVESVK